MSHNDAKRSAIHVAQNHCAGIHTTVQHSALSTRSSITTRLHQPRYMLHRIATQAFISPSITARLPQQLGALRCFTQCIIQNSHPEPELHPSAAFEHRHARYRPSVTNSYSMASLPAQIYNTICTAQFTWNGSLYLLHRIYAQAFIASPVCSMRVVT